MPGTGESRGGDKRKVRPKTCDLQGIGGTEVNKRRHAVHLESLKGKLHVISLLQIHIVHEQLTGSHLHEHCQQLQAKRDGMGIESTSFYVNSLYHGNRERELLPRINACASLGKPFYDGNNFIN